ncbi:MAG: hypothetical protein WAN11_19290 [Syntrophobacteraceae bacterium]
MSKKLILGMALSLLFLNGSFFSVQAGCKLSFNGSPLLSSSSPCGSKNMDKATMTRQQSPATSQGPFKYDTNKNGDLSNDSWQDMTMSRSFGGSISNGAVSSSLSSANHWDWVGFTPFSALSKNPISLEPMNMRNSTLPEPVPTDRAGRVQDHCLGQDHLSTDQG